MCRQRNHEMLGLLLEAGCSVQVCDDFGRTPLHDACWTSSPNFELISMLLDQDPWLLCLQDCRGSTPLGYVKDHSHYRLWIEYLDQVADKYWPFIPDCASAVSPNGPNESARLELPRVISTTPPLVLVEPNSRPIVKTELLSSLEVIERVANGLLQPGEVKKVKEDDHQDPLTTVQSEKCNGTRRISLDPLGTKVALSATSLVSVPGLHHDGDAQAEEIKAYSA